MKEKKVKTHPYVDKNKCFDTQGNENIDKLFYMMDTTAVVSEPLKTRIRNLCLWILTNHEKHIKAIEDAMNELDADLKFTSIFHERFTGTVYFCLLAGLGTEKYKATQRKKEEKKKVK